MAMRKNDKRMLVVGLMLAAVAVVNCYSRSVKGASSLSSDTTTEGALLKEVAGYKQWINVNPRQQFIIDASD